jgi:peptide/nickel transport system ATP-binding protein
VLLDPGTPQQQDLAALDPEGKAMRAVRGGRIGLIFQEPMSALSMHYTVGNQIIEATRAHSDMSKAEARQRVVALLHEVGIPRPETRIDAYPFQLSGGLRQRVGIALALAADPQILIADEPTTALDVTTQAQILALLRRLQRTKGVALMLITHDMGVIAQMADDVAVMYLGRMVEFAPVEQLFSSPQHPYTRALLRSVPNLRATPRERLATIGGAVPHPGARPVGCPFHPRCPEIIKGRCESEAPPEIPPGERGASCFHAVGTTTPAHAEATA